MTPSLLRFSFLFLLSLVFGCAGEPATEHPLETIPKLDIHAHYTYERDYLPALLDEWNMQAMLVEVIHVDDNPRRNRWPAMQAHHRAEPDRTLLCASFDATKIDEPRFADDVIAQLEQDIADGARMVKVWKEIGMVIRDASGQFIQIDDPRFQPIWDFLASRRIPVLAHIGEPRAAWLPLDPTSPHYGYYSENPRYHAYNDPEIPRWETIMEARDRWLARNPALTVIGAHLGSMAYDVHEVARRLDRYPNFYVEPAARFGDLGQQPAGEVRDFFITYQDRVLYGTDLNNRRPAAETTPEDRQSERSHIERDLTLHWRYLTGADTVDFQDYGTSYPAVSAGLDLPRAVVEKIYYGNASRLLGL